MGRGRKRTHEFTDQFGDAGGATDRDEQFGGGRGAGGGRGGGSAGGRGPKGNVTFQRALPKFLQQYAHMLPGGGGGGGEDEPGGEEEGGEAPPRHRSGRDGGSDDDEDDNCGDEEAIQRALQENPELAAQLDERVRNKIEAAAVKEEGNRAFAAKRYREAADHFTRAIELDPKSEVYFSNRSAARAALGDYQAALDDADAAAVLKPRWAKAHARRAAALVGLKRYGDAREAYDAALRIEPDDQALQRARDKANAMELQQARENKHTFAAKRAKPSGVNEPSRGGGGGGGGSGGGSGGRGGGGGGGGGGGSIKGPTANRPAPAAAKKDSKLLSFGGDGDEEDA